MPPIARIVGLWACLASGVAAPVAASASGTLPPDLPAIAGATITTSDFRTLPGWTRDDHRAALETFRTSCRAIVEDRDALRTGAPTPVRLRAICADALSAGLDSGEQARLFFERHFQPLRIVPGGRSLLTGYFEPEINGSPVRTDDFTHPLLARPDNLVTFAAGQQPAELGELTAARRTRRGLLPYPTREDIEAGELGNLARPLVYVEDEVEAFTIHVQGSARIRLPDGRSLRVGFAGRNGHPYSSIGRIIVSEGHLPLQEASMDRLVPWLRANPEQARRIMRMNRSFIFFRLADELDPAKGPLGAASVQLAPGRSIAVDRAIWAYGLPIFISANLDDVPATANLPAGSLNRLMVAQDTGAAIVGPVRADLFVGSGAAAGVAAGRLRHPFEMVVLWPRQASP